MQSDRQRPAERLLICGPVFPPGAVGGLPLALSDLGASLHALGWTVDLAVTPDSLGLPLDARTHRHMAAWASARWTSLPRLRFIDGDARRMLQHLLLDGGWAHVSSAAMRLLERRLRETRYEAVVAVITRESPGMARFITSAYPNVVLVSLDGLQGELRLRRWLPLARLTAARGGVELHPAAYRTVDPTSLRRVVFASESWKAEGLRAGILPSAAHTIYFGLRECPPLEPPPPSRERLLWVGRASREKGLHHFIEALALVRRTRPATLTAVCAPGPASYRAQLEAQIAALGLENAVRLRDAVPRAALPAFYRSHDALLFDSVFGEPVALVATEAFACGIPVVARRPSTPGPLLVPDETCVTFSSSHRREVAAAILRMLGDDTLRHRLRRQAHDVVRRRFSMDAAARAYDALLRGAAAGTAGSSARSA